MKKVCQSLKKYYQTLRISYIYIKDLLCYVVAVSKKEAPMTCNVHILKQSVVLTKCDAIVNAANTSLLGGGGVDGAIHNMAGPDLLKACSALGGCETGSAKITKAYNIKTAKYIIHAVGPVYSGRTSDPQLLGSCYSSALNLALANSCSSIAFPCISTGVYSYPLNKAADVVINSLEKWAAEHKDANLEIYLCCFRQEEYDSYLALNRGDEFTL